MIEQQPLREYKRNQHTKGQSNGSCSSVSAFIASLPVLPIGESSKGEKDPNEKSNGFFFLKLVALIGCDVSFRNCTTGMRARRARKMFRLPEDQSFLCVRRPLIG